MKIIRSFKITLEPAPQDDPFLAGMSSLRATWIEENPISAALSEVHMRGLVLTGDRSSLEFSVKKIMHHILEDSQWRNYHGL